MEIKDRLIQKLKAENCFWSFDNDSITNVEDEIVIEKTLVYLDIPEINQLFDIYKKRKIKQVWLKCLVPQGQYLHTLNRFLAWYYFDIKNPDIYLKSMETRHFNHLCR